MILPHNVIRATQPSKRNRVIIPLAQVSMTNIKSSNSNFLQKLAKGPKFHSTSKYWEPNKCQS